MNWNIADRWEGTYSWVPRPFDSIPELPNLRKLCILANGVDSVDYKRDTRLIDAKLWAEKKHLFLPKWKALSYIPEVDIFMPMKWEVLREAGDEFVGSVRVHGVDEEEAKGKPVFCACKHMPKNRVIPQPGTPKWRQFII